MKTNIEIRFELSEIPSTERCDVMYDLFAKYKPILIVCNDKPYLNLTINQVSHEDES